MFDHNRNLARIFKDMSAMYKYLGGEERFRALAYLKASRVMESLPQDVSVYAKSGTLEDLSGIGEGIAGKITEYLETGKIKKYDELKQLVPFEFLDMGEIKGLGPRTLKTLHEKLDINTKQELIDALTGGRINTLKGFGEKKVANMLRSLKLHKTIEDRMLLWTAIELGERVLADLKEMKEVVQAELAGSLRRKKETIGDIDVLVTCRPGDRKR